MADVKLNAKVEKLDKYFKDVTNIKELILILKKIQKRKKFLRM